MSIQEFIQFFLSICGGVSIVGGAAAVIFKWIAPAFRLDSQINGDNVEELKKTKQKLTNYLAQNQR